ncbi:MAG: septum formation initiator family protein [Myxococcota bacterium]
MDKLVLRFFLNVLPLSVVIFAVGYTLIGEEGILNRHTLKQRLISTQDQVERLETRNDILRARIRAIREDPDAVRREAADRLLLAPSGSTIYRFR